MLVKLLSPNKDPYWVRAEHIRSVERSLENPLICVVSTILASPQGFLNYAAMGPPEDIVAEINAALQQHKLQ